MHVYRGWRIGKGPCMVWKVLMERSEKGHEKRRGEQIDKGSKLSRMLWMSGWGGHGREH